MNSHPTLTRTAASSAAWVAVLLLVPMVAMLVTREVNWGIGDFVVAGVLIFSARMAYALAIRKVTSRPGRLAWAVMILIGFLLVWAELAVGISG